MADGNHTGLPADREVAGKLVDAQAQQAIKKLDRGGLGWVFGTKDHVPNNIAGTVVAICIISIVYLLLFSASFAENKDKIAVISPILTLFGGYLFGKNSKD